VGDTERSLIIAVVLVIGVVFVFLQSPRATLIPAVVLPLSILGTFGPMYLLGYSIDNLSLMALTIATGFVVDDAVVVLENIVRHLEAGLSRVEAALRGSAEVGFTVISMSLSLIAVFIPILLMPGIVGLLFHEFAVTLSIAILFSLLISLTSRRPCAPMCSSAAKACTPRPAGRSGPSAVRALQGRLLALAHRGARPCAAGRPGADRPDRAQRLAVQAGALDLFPGTGQWIAHRADHRRPEHFLSGDESQAAAVAANRAEDPAVPR
jgi:hypothetical protein